MSSAACILAAPDLEVEPAIVQLAAGLSLRIVRRSLDAADLLAVASIELHTPVVVSAGLPRLTSEVVATLQRGNRKVIGLANTPAEIEHLRALGISLVLTTRTPEGTSADLIAALQGNAAPTRRSWETGAWQEAAGKEPKDLPETELEVEVESAPEHEPRTAYLPQVLNSGGQILSIWGPNGAPGRTTTALTVAQLIAVTGKSVCIIDADTSGPALALLFGVVEDASGIVVATRYAQRKSLCKESLLSVVRQVADGIGVIGGVSHPDRWEELHPHSFRDVLKMCRRTFDYTCVDLGAGVDPSGSDREFFESQRFAVTTTGLRESDAVLAIGLAAPLGVSRLLTSLGLVSNLAGKDIAIAIRPHDGVDSREAIATLRAYGCTQEMFEMPRISTNDALRNVGFKRQRHMLRKQKDRWTPLESWAMRSRHGDGSTTMSVPTCANL